MSSGARVTTHEASGPGLYDGTGSHAKPWWPSPYGTTDEIGAANEVTRETTRAALRLPEEGSVIDLGRVLDNDIPTDPNRTYDRIILAHNSLQANWAGRGSVDVSSLEEHASHSYHVGTHVDGLAHVGIGQRFYNGATADELFALRGLTRLGAHNIPPLVTRGVLIDVAATSQRVLCEGSPVTRSDLESALSQSNLSIEPGDAVLIHTGWGDLWHSDPVRYAAGEPGIDEDAALWLAAHRPCLIGSDNWALEVVPNPDPRRSFVVHQQLITVLGIYILENLDLSGLAQRPERHFLFIFSPIPARGATGALVRPLAIV
jgi:kynurenine formamidase